MPSEWRDARNIRMCTVAWRSVFDRQRYERSGVLSMRRLGRTNPAAILAPLTACLLINSALAQASPKIEPASPLPDDRYKADMLLVLAHPDDELLVASYLARVVLDEHKRVAVIFATRGNAGENKIGYEQAASLAAIREIEARRALGILNIANVWFLNVPDTPAPNGHNVLRSLENWNHGATLGDVVRIIRLTRPAVVLTHLPGVVVGENNGDHQAAGVIATEAFGISGDPTQFPEQVAFPEDPKTLGVLVEGLRPWQAQKLYYFSDADPDAFLEGKGPAYPIDAISASGHREYFRYWLAMANIYRTQFENIPAADAPPPANFHPSPQYLIFGKSLVGGSTTGDVFDGVGPEPLPYKDIPGYQPRMETGMSIELGGAWHFYREFWPAHNLEHLAELLPVPEIRVVSGGTLYVPLLLHNNTSRDGLARLRIELPTGWTEKKGSALYPISSHGLYPVGTILLAPSLKHGEYQEIRFSVESEGKAVRSTTLRVYVKGPQ